jgi:hypothetical protein
MGATEVADSPTATFLRPPSACGSEFERLDWTGTVAVHVEGDKHLGLRFNDAAVQQAVTRALGDRVVADLTPVPYYSLKLGTPGRRHKTPMHYLYLGPRPVLGTRDLGRLLDGLALHLSAQVTRRSPTGHEGYLVDALAVRTPNGVLLVPAQLMAMANVVDRVLVGAGFALADAPYVQLDPARREVVVPEPVVPIAVPDEELSGLGPSASEERLAPGRYPLAGWLMKTGADEAGPLRKAKALLYGAGLLVTPFPRGAQAALEDLLDLFDDVGATGVAWSSEEELVEAVRLSG